MPYLAAISLALGLVRFISWLWTTVWGKEARLDAKIKYLEAEKTRAQIERDRLKGIYQDIDQTPPKTGNDLKDGLNDAWNKKKP